ncbi:hypothetical protein DFH09DRAFT_1317579 [Mycena vulgaris]|nr:hypothetical protein DFH09DRAFT_1317579 [Mycena vulgaris]
MFLLDLDDDVLGTLLSACDVYTVLIVATVNRNLRTLALSKSVWLALVADLTARCLMDPLPNEMLDTCSSLDLITEVRRLVCGPTTWADLFPTVGRTRSIRLPVGCTSKAKLLPGGRYVAVFRESSFDCWNLISGKCVWSPEDTCLLAMEMFDGGTSGRFLLQDNFGRAFNVFDHIL